MKKFIALMTLIVGFQANAGLISIDLSNDSPSIGESIEVTVTGTDFAPFDTLDLNIEFDTSLFAVDNLDLLGDIDSAFVGGDLASSGGILALSSQAFGVALSFVDFALFAGGDFTLASFNITAIESGDSNFAPAAIVAGAFDFFSGSLTPIDVTAADQDVSASVVAEVPVPAIWSLMGFAFVLMVMRHRKI
jgi:hypothetical protein